MTHHARAAPALSCVHHGNLAVPLRPYNSVDEPQDQHGCACSANLSKPHFCCMYVFKCSKVLDPLPFRTVQRFFFLWCLAHHTSARLKSFQGEGLAAPRTGVSSGFCESSAKRRGWVGLSRNRCSVAGADLRCISTRPTHNPSPNAGRVCGLTAFNGFTGPVVLQPTRESWCSQSVFAAAKQYSQREQNFERGCAAPPLRFSSSNWTVLKETHLCMSKMQQRLFFW